MEETKLLYDGKLEDFLWVGFGSGSGTNLRECTKVIMPGLIFSDKPSAKIADPSKAKEYGLEVVADVPRLVLNGYKACGSWKTAQGNTAKEEAYERRSIQYNKDIVQGLHEFEQQQGRGIDLIVLGGYMRWVKDPLLEAYIDKIINVHPADSSIIANDYSKMEGEITALTEEFSRVFIGGDAVYDAILAGATQTKSSVIMVDDGEDDGEILTQGAYVAVDDGFLRLSDEEKERQLREYVDGTDDSKGHQDRQKEESDWPALTTALRLIAEGRIALGTEKRHFNKWRTVYVDGKEMPYKGYQVEKAA